MTAVGYCDKCGRALGVWPLSKVGQLVHITEDGGYVYVTHRPVLSDLLRVDGVMES